MSPGEWERVKDVFEAALGRQGADRTAYLAAACEGDESLRDEVERLLAGHDQAGSFLEQSPSLPVDSNAAEASGQEDLRMGQTLSHYQIAARLGQGGMGTVYRAMDLQLCRPVAIKVLRRRRLREMDPDRRFVREARAASALNHPNICHVYEIGEADGIRFIAMEYIEGRTLEAAIRDGPLELAEIARIGAQTAEALAEANAHGIIHRDIKPSNLMIGPRGDLKILDFGIAKVNWDPEAGAAVFHTSSLTGPGILMGTVQYMSPEQLLGRDLDHRTDVFSLGLVLYEMATGRPAFQGTTPMETIDQVLHARPEPLAPWPELERIVGKCLEKERERRYQSASEVAVELRKVGLPYRSRKFLKRNRVPTAVAALSAALVLALVAGLDRVHRPFAARNATIRSVAVLPLENVSRDPQQEPLIDGITEALIGDLGKIKSLRVISLGSVMRYKGVHQPAALTARELNANALVEASVLRSGDRVRINFQLTAAAMGRVLWTQTYDRDLQDVPAMESDVARAIAREIQIQLTPQEETRLSSSSPVNRQAYEAYLRGRYQLYKHTHEGYEKGLQAFKEAIDIDPAYAPAWAGLADGYYEISTAVLPAREAMPKARAAALKALAIDGTLAEAHATLAQIQSQYDWDWAAAERSYKRALELNASYAQGHLYYAWYLAEQGRMEDAIGETAEAQRLDPLPPWRETNLAWMYYLARRTDQAMVQYRRILQLDPDSAVTHYGLGHAYVAKRMFEQGIAEFLKAQALDENCCLAFLSHAYAVSGKREQARRILEKLLEHSRVDFVDSYAIGMIHVGLGEKDKAFEWLEKAYQERSEELLFLKVEPVLDPLRADPRFQSLIRRIGLPP